MDREFTLRDYVTVLRNRWRWVVGAFAIIVGLALVYSVLTTPMYRAEASLLIDTETATAGILDESTGQRADEERIVETEVEFISSRSVADAAADTLGFDPADDVSARGASDANVISISSVSDDPDEAAEIANTYANSYIDLRRKNAVDEYQASAVVVQERIDELDTQIADLGSDDPGRAPLERTRELYITALENLQIGADLFGGVRPQIISEAEIPDAPFQPKTTRNMVLAGVMGLVVGVGLALLRETLDTSIRTKSDLEEAAHGLPTLALVPAASGWRDTDSAKVLSLESPDGDAAEAYRTLRTAIQFLSLDKDLSVIQLTSPKPGEGKSTTTANLAVAFARAGKRVVVVDCDLRKPRAHRFFGVRPEPGVTNILLGETDAAEAARRPIAELPILVLPAGRPAPNPSEVLASKAASELFEKLRNVADVVLVDSPPVLPVSDPRVLAGNVDALVLITETKGSDRHEVSRAVELLQQVNAPLVGTVLNRVGRRAASAYGYGYRYTYHPADYEGDSPAHDAPDDLDFDEIEFAFKEPTKSP